jgi:hypothetical protein
MVLPDLAILTVILVGLAFGFISFTAAIAWEFFGPMRLPRWARTCVPKRRGTSLFGHLLGTIVFVFVAAFAVIIVLTILLAAIGSQDLAGTGVSTFCVIAMALWVVYLRKRYVEVPRT